MSAAKLTRADRRLLEMECELVSLRARYDDGAVSPPVYRVIRDLETEIAWAEHNAGGTSP
jgi:hypothetical protein